MKNYLLVNRALAAEKNFNLFNNLFSRVKEHSSPTVNRRSTDGQSQRQYSIGIWKYVAMIFAVLVMSMANVGKAWGDTSYYLFTPTSAPNPSHTGTLSGDFVSPTASSDSKTIDTYTFTHRVGFGSALGTGNLAGSTAGNKSVDYYVKTTSTTFRVYLYNNSGSTAYTLYYATITEGSETVSESSISVAASFSGYKEFTVSSTTNTTVAIYFDNTNIRIMQVVATESGTAHKQAGEAGYTLSFNKGRIALNSSKTITAEGLSIKCENNFTYASSESLTFKKNNPTGNYLSFTTPAGGSKIAVTWSGDGQIAYNTSAAAAGATSMTSGTEYTLNGSTTYYVINSSSGSGASITKLEFKAAAAKAYTVTAATSTGDNSLGTVSAAASSLDATETTTITAVPASGYRVTNWAVSGTGASISPDGASNSNTTTLTMGTANATVTATFGPKSYTVTLNNQSATTAGTASVTTTYNANTNLTSAITCPTKTSKVFAGYFTATNGGGVQLIDAAGNWIASAGGGSTYLDGSKNWKNDGNLTLYACWMEYASTFDIQAWVQSNLSSGSTTKTFTSLTTNKLLFSLSGNTELDNSSDASNAYDGLKFKNNGDYILFLVQANSSLKLYFGYTDTKPKISINGGAESTVDVGSTGSKTADQEVDFGTQTYDRLIKLRTVTSNTVVLQKIEITAPAVAGCTDKYSFHYGTNEQSDWTTECFSKVGDTHEWQLTDFVIPDKPNYYVGKNGSFYNDGLNYENAKSYMAAWEYMYFAASQGDGAGTRPRTGEAVGAIGTVRVYDNSTWDNLQVAFMPDGYKLKIGSTEYPFAFESGNEYRSGIVEYSSSNARDNVSVGIVDASGNYVSTANTQEMQHIFLNTGGGDLWSTGGVTNFGIYDVTNSNWACLMTRVPGETYLYEGWVPSNCGRLSIHRLASSSLKWKANDSDGSNTNVYNSTNDLVLQSGQNLWTVTGWNGGDGNWSAYSRKGKYCIWDSSIEKNWGVCFHPYHVLTYDANGGSGAPSEQVVPGDGNSAARTITISSTEPTRNGYSFEGWATSSANAAAGTKAYDPGDDITLSADVELFAIWSCVDPTITTDLSEDQVDYYVGDAATALTVAATAAGGSVSYQWYSNDEANTTTPTTLTTGASYTPSTAAAGTTYYYCVITNSTAGCSTTATSSFAKIVVSRKDPNKYDFTATSASICSGSDATFTLASSQVGATYYLTKANGGGSAIGDSKAGTGSALTFTATSATTGDYYCWTSQTTAFNAMKVSNSKVTISYKTATSVTVDDATLDDAVVDEEYTISGITGAGAGTLYYQWYSYSDDEGSDETAIVGADADTYAFTPDTEGNYYFKCKVTGDCGSVKSELITVTASPGCDDPSASLSDGAYTIGGSALDLRTLWSSSNTKDDVTFTVTNANGTGATIAGDGYSFSATTAGTATISASQTSTGDYCDAAETATITVSNPTYTVTYTTTGSTGGTAPTDSNSPYESGSTVTVKGNTGSLVKTGYVFLGWSDGNSNNYAPGETFTISGNTTLSPIWKEGTSATITYTMVVGDKAWSASGSSNETTGIPNAGVTIITTNAGISGNGTGSRTSKLAIKTGANGATYDSPTNYILYNFSVASGYAFTPSDITIQIANVGSSSANNIKYKAVLSDASSHSISTTYICTTGNGTVEAFHLYNEDGVTFDGSVSLKLWAWTIADKSDGGSAYRLGTPLTIAGVTESTTTLYDISTSATNGTIAVTDDEDNEIDEAAEGDEVTITATPSDGYEFTSWAVSGTGATLSSTTDNPTTLTMGTADATVTATFTAINYTLTWDLAGGTVTTAGTGADVDATGTPSSSVAYGTDITAPTVTKTGYTFAGWSSDVASTMPAANTTYTATWTANTYDVDFSLTNVEYSSGDNEGTDVATYGTDFSTVFAAADGYTLPDEVTVTIGGAGTTHYTWNASTGELTIDGAYILGDIVVTIVAEEEGCTPQTVSKVVVTGSSDGTTSGYNNKEYVGTPVISVSGTTKDKTNIDGNSGDETGYKMSSDGNSIVFATLAKGTFQVGDVVKIGITRRNDTRQVDSKYNILTIYYGTNKSDADSLTTITTLGDNDNSAADHEGAGFYEYELTSSDITTIGSKKGIGLFRASSNGENPYVYSVEIIGCRDWTTCTAPTAVAADDVTGTSATFTITDAENTLDYELYVSTSSTSPTAETSATATSSEKTKTVTGLSGTTTYYYWVRSNCGGFKSAWVAGTPATFTTETAYTVTYNGNGSTGGSVPTDATGYAEGDVVTVKTNSGSLVKSGYTFVGWSTNATPSSGIFYPAGYKFTMGAANVTLYAVWGSTGAQSINIAYFEASQHNSKSSKPDAAGKYLYGYTNSTKTIASAYTLTTSTTNNKGQGTGDSDYMRVDYGTTVNIYADTVTVSGTPAGFDDVTSVSVDFKMNNSSYYTTFDIYVGSTKIADNVSLVGDAQSSFTTFTYSGLSNLDGVVKIVNKGSGSTNYNFHIDNIVINYGSGVATGFDVTFDKNGQGSFSQTINNVPSGSKIGAPIPAPTATGYEFGGWYREAGCSNEWNFGSNTITKDTTLYAKWTTCAPSISADPSGTSYNQNADATALSVTATGKDLTYQWYSNEANSNSDGTEIPGATSASYTPSTALVGTIYYYCIVTNDCGNATSAVAAITVNDSKPNPTASWTIATPTHGGKGFSFSVAVKKNDGSTAWDGTLTAAMLSASEDVVLSDVTVNNSTKTISGTYGVNSSATSPVSFFLELPSTATQAAAMLVQERTFTACEDGEEGETYKVPLNAKYSSKASGRPDYYSESDYGYISPELGVSSVSIAPQEYGDEFDYYFNAGRSSVLIGTKVADVKKIQIYLNANSGSANVTKVYIAAAYSSKLSDYSELSPKSDYSISYVNANGEDSSIPKGDEGYIELEFTTSIDNGTQVYVVLKNAAKYYGAKLITAGSASGTIPTSLAWSNSQASGATVAKHEDDAEFTITANRSNADAEASLGTIHYYSSDATVATVGALNGQVTIADAIDFGGETYKTTTITAVLMNSGCYMSAEINYTLKVDKNECADAAGTIEITEDNGCEGKVMTLSGYEDGAGIQWQKDGEDIPSATEETYTATSSGTYTVVTHKTCDRTSNSIVVEMETASASKIVDSWYVKNGRRTPDIALVQTTGASGFTVTSGGSPLSDIGGCTFELKEDGIIYLHGTKPNGDAPSDMTEGDMTITITATGCGGNADGLDITIKRQAETLKPSVAFVVDGTTRAKGGTATSVSADKTSKRPLWTYLSSTFALTGCNIYWSVDSKELREYYSQYDAIVVTDDPNTATKGAGDVEYVKAFGTLVDVRPILTMEAYVGKYKNGGWHVYNAEPTSPNPRQVEMKLECKNHEIFAGVSEASDNVRSENINGDDYWYITIVDTTQSPYKGTEKDYKALPALQGFNPNAFSEMLGIGTINEDKLQAGVERQQEPAARMMILGIQNNAMGALTNEGKLIIKNAISYLLKTNMEEVDDCSNYFIGGAEGKPNDWTEATNWSKNSVPDFATKVRIMAPVVIENGQKVRASQVDIVVDGTSSKKDGELNGHVTINPGGALVVGGTVNRAIAPHYGIDDLEPTTDEDLFIQADASNNAALILDNSSGLTGATVQMYSRSHWAWNLEGTKIVKYWSYVAVPIQEALIPDYFYGAFTYYYVEKDGWDKKWDGDYLYPFQAIGLSRDAAGIENFWGPLVSTENRDIKLTKTSMGGGENMIANSWTAPIQIANFDIDDFGDAKATIYMYDTGIEGDPNAVIVEEATGSYTGTGTAGQWLGIPVGVAKLPEYNGLNVIPAMQTFEVDFPPEAEYGSESTLHLDYNRLVRGVDITEDNLTERLHAPKRNMNKNDGNVEAVMKVRVAGVHTLADVWLIQDGAFSDGYDNGWEANYAACDDRSPQLYAHSEMGNMGVIAKPELEGTILGFAPSRDGADYTFSFYYRGDEELYLNDLLTETSTPITNDDTYAFTASENGDGSRFIISRNPYQQPLNPTSTETVGADGQNRAKKIIYNDKIYILYNGMIYDAMGRVINRK